MSAGERPDLVVTVDPHRCVGSMSCVLLAPDHFALDDHDRARPLAPRTAWSAAVEEAERRCPTGAISVGPQRGGERA